MIILFNIIVTSHLASFVFKRTAVDIGFLAPVFFAIENGSAAAIVCAQIDRGSLEREVVAYLSTIPGGTATRKHKHNVKCPLGILSNLVYIASCCIE